MRLPERTCIGCRGRYRKDEVVRIVAGPEGVVLDYREKLPGRAAYVCPREHCIEKAFSRENLSRSLRTGVKPPAIADFVALLVSNISQKIKSLIAISAKAGKLAAGYSAVQDAIEKGRPELLLYACDISEGTKEKLALHKESSVREAVIFTRDELGAVLNRELVGVVALEDKGLSDAVWKETERLKSLININQ
jgi:predicted RNA-binding protein YlxR (DUF448 family)